MNDMSSQFIQRLVNYLANEVLIKGLANSKTFQRFAVRTDATLRDVHKTGTETLQQTLDEAVRQSSSSSTTAAQGPPIPPLKGFAGFVSAFSKEIRKDVLGTPS